ELGARLMGLARLRIGARQAGDHAHLDRRGVLVLAGARLAAGDTAGGGGDARGEQVPEPLQASLPVPSHLSASEVGRINADIRALAAKLVRLSTAAIFISIMPNAGIRCLRHRLSSGLCAFTSASMYGSGVRVFEFGPEHGRHVTHHASDFTISRLARTGAIHVACMRLGPGGAVGYHRAMSHQILAVVEGAGWARGEGPERTPSVAGNA